MKYGGYLSQIARWLHSPTGMAACRYLTIGGLASTEVLVVFFLQDAIGHELDRHYIETYMYQEYKRRLFAGLLTVPIGFLLWLRLLERDGRITLGFSPLMTIISFAGFMAIPALFRHFEIMRDAFVVAVIAGLFAFVPVGEWLRRTLCRPRAACVALIAASAAWDYYWLMTEFLSHTLLFYTASAVASVLGVFGIDIFVNEGMESRFVYDIYSKNFMIHLAPYCSGLEGIFLFLFLFSGILLFDWERYKSMRLLPIYCVGVIGMFFVNTLRVAAFFAVGYWAFTPGEPEWVQSLRGAPLYLFHSYVGWVFYLIAFGIFIRVLTPRKLKSAE